MAQCPKCGSENNNGDSFCRICGGSLASAPVGAPDPKQRQESNDLNSTEQGNTVFSNSPENNRPSSEQFGAAPQNNAPRQRNDTPGQQYNAPQYGASNYNAQSYSAVPQYTPPVYGSSHPSGVDNTPEMTWGSFFWTRVLFCIPVVGVIFMFVWALGGTSNNTRKQYARSYLFPGLILLAVAVVVSIVILVILYATGSSPRRYF